MPPDHPSDRDEPGEHKLGRIGRFLSLVLLALPIITLLGSLIVGYYQYWTAYQEKVAKQAKDELQLASDTFEEISTTFSDTLALQNLLYSNFTSAIRGKYDASATALTTKNASDVSRTYEKAHTDLREKIEVLARKAQRYIDWASDKYRDPAQERNVDADPLSLTLLGNYRFDCADPVNFPEFGSIWAQNKTAADIPDHKFCASERKQGIDDDTKQQNAFIRICPAGHNGTARRIYWFSAKHHVLTMYHCLNDMHAQLEPVRQWASQSDRNAEKESEIAARAHQIVAGLDNLAYRLKSFDNLAMYHLEGIQVKYRPAGFECTIPILQNLYARCLPLATTTTAVPPPPPKPTTPSP